MDVRASFLQTKGFERTIYVKPTRQENQPNMLWKLLAAAYGLVDSGRLWYLASNSALCYSLWLNRSVYEPTLYYSCHRKKQLDLLVVVQVDNNIYIGIEKRMSEFEAYLKNQFDIGVSVTISNSMLRVYRVGKMVLLLLTQRKN